VKNLESRMHTCVSLVLAPNPTVNNLSRANRAQLAMKKTTLPRTSAYTGRGVSIDLSKLDQRASPRESVISPKVAGKRSSSSSPSCLDFRSLTVSKKCFHPQTFVRDDCEICGLPEKATENVICNLCQTLLDEGSMVGNVPKKLLV